MKGKKVADYWGLVLIGGIILIFTIPAYIFLRFVGNQHDTFAEAFILSISLAIFVPCCYFLFIVLFGHKNEKIVSIEGRENRAGFLLNLLAIFAGLLTTLFVAAILLGIKSLINIWLITFCIICFPIFAFVGGLASTLIYFKIMGKDKARMGMIQSGSAALMGLLGFWALYYGLYKITYITADMEINYRGKGSHISEFVYKDSGAQITFERHLKQLVENRRSSYIGFAKGIAFRGSDPAEYRGRLRVIRNWVGFLMEFLFFLIGATSYSYFASEMEEET